jgi:GR25 family glycosyltransferase involved in LPS biosynthesis
MKLILFIIIVIIIFIWVILLCKKIIQEKYDIDKINIMYININKDIDRNNKMIEQLNKYENIKYKRINAVTPNDISESEWENFHKNCPHQRKTEFACILSHIKAIHTAYHQGLDYVVICEDDIIFRRSITKGVIDSSPKDWELLQLFSLEADVYNKTELWIDTILMNGTQCYIINRNGMKKILELSTPNLLTDRHWNNRILRFDKLNIDGHCVADLFMYKYIKSYTSTDHFLYPDTNVNSSISPDNKGRVEYQNMLINSVLDQFKNTGFKRSY